MNLVRIELVALFLCLATACAAAWGVNTGDRLHATDYQNGWTAGFSSGQAVDKLTNDRLAAGGLCKYAQVACGGQK